MDAFWTVHPGVRDRVLTVQGALRPHVNLFVGPESVRFSGGLATPDPDGAEVSILSAISGGADHCPMTRRARRDRASDGPSSGPRRQR